MLRSGSSQGASWTFEVVIAPEPDLVSRLRRITTTFLLRWSTPSSLADDAVVTVSELVTNGIEHGHGPVVLRARLTDKELLVEVSDESLVPARLRAPTGDEVRGRGLLLVSALAHDWGVRDEGRTTWAAFHVHGNTS
ncbi:ATP-binding protein [Streptomyces albidoflavus]|uniref:ATP-binding protein n=1 Tax=Streptomyces koyangensis TaxID=188770 RepID=UPI003D063C61|nr:ATP-binding protein [Streptomyces albidoflavus]